MSPEEPKDLSRAEWKVMKIVWELEKAMAREVYTIAGQRYGWTPATVKTLLKRLADKGYVSTTPVGNGFIYRPARSALATLRSAADALITNAVEGATGPLLAHLVERMPLSEGDLDALQKLIDARKKSLGKPGKKST
jgi:BlaI family penicillinase repressor